MGDVTLLVFLPVSLLFICVLEQTKLIGQSNSNVETSVCPN